MTTTNTRATCQKSSYAISHEDLAGQGGTTT